MGKGVIAIIEDDEDIAGFYLEILADEGYEPLLWRTGAGAYAFIKRAMPVAVILDMHMETRDAGMVVAHALCDDPQTKGIPVIVCSAGLDGEREKREKLEALGCNIHSKPIDLPVFLALLDELTSRQQSFR